MTNAVIPPTNRGHNVLEDAEHYVMTQLSAAYGHRLSNTGAKEYGPGIIYQDGREVNARCLPPSVAAPERRWA